LETETVTETEYGVRSTEAGAGLVAPAGVRLVLRLVVRLVLGW
jgi:hypothetical protein